MPALARPGAPRGDPHLLRAARDARATSRSSRSTSIPATGRLDLADLRAEALRPHRRRLPREPVLPRRRSRPTRREIAGSRTPRAPRRSSASTRSRLGVLAPPGDWGADIVVGTTQPLGVHMNCGGGVGGFIATRDEERYAREYPTLHMSHLRHDRARRARLRRRAVRTRPPTALREQGNDWTGNSVYLWAIADAVVHGAARARSGFARARRR